MLNLDTHVLVALLAGELSKHEENRVLSEPLGISGIVLWELAKLTQLGRLKIDFESTEFRTALRFISVIPVSLEIAIASTRLDFKSDPAEEIIAATSVVENMPLLTRDKTILRSKLVPLAL